MSIPEDPNIQESKENEDIMMMKMQPRKILFSDHFIDTSLKDTDRLNTVLDETFQLTVRQRMYQDDPLDNEIFMTAKDDFGNGSDSDDFEASPSKIAAQGLPTQKPLKVYDIDDEGPN